LRYLEEVIISTLADYGLKAGRSDGETGVWLEEGTPFARKICAMGVKASRWTTMHGFAFNINTPLDHFNYIVPCGIADKAVTSLHIELGREVDEQEVKDKIAYYFQRQFNCVFVPTTKPYSP
jgi:lipoyl(octanoyl) transferase